MENKSNILPLPGWVLIEPIREEDTVVGGLVLPDSSQDIPQKGTVLSVWDTQPVAGNISITSFEDYKAASVHKNLKRDDVVLYKKYSGQTVKHEGRELKLVEFKDLLAVIE